MVIFSSFSSVREPVRSGRMTDSKAPDHDGKYDEYNYEQDKYEVGGGSGKGRTKKETEQHTNHHDPGGHTRKTTQKLVNSHEKEKEQRKEHPKESKWVMLTT